MGKYKEITKSHVVSIRISDAEKLAIEEMLQRGNTTISRLMREAILLYTSQCGAKG